MSVHGENYDPRAMTANGYRIKEMGDGFLCSIGFPFKVPGGENPAQKSLSLAYQFVRVFQSIVNLHHRQPIFCSMGLAYDELEGYYPKTGTIEYDVYGRGIILAIRYESIRKLLFPEGLDGHLITLHGRVYDYLTRRQQRQFTVVDLNDYDFKVRGDREARFLYYQVIAPADATRSKAGLAV